MLMSVITAIATPAGILRTNYRGGITQWRTER
jgi:hypothetical protein